MFERLTLDDFVDFTRPPMTTSPLASTDEASVSVSSGLRWGSTDLLGREEPPGTLPDGRRRLSDAAPDLL
jgi:hypothetical protein